MSPTPLIYRCTTAVSRLLVRTHVLPLSILLGALLFGAAGEGSFARAATEALSICATGGAVPDATNTGLISDCETLLAVRDTLAGDATLDWSADVPIAEWEGSCGGWDAAARHGAGRYLHGVDRDDTAGTGQPH